ncbi:hypothetical protein CCMA1212_006949 [Trichoderma ghanense]|uniref:Uncharacterized protein n=1 Tax=Trichoderma ghanense TaxID=65468 RepID=A0ABY2GZ85_9HYPO
MEFLTRGIPGNVPNATSQSLDVRLATGFDKEPHCGRGGRYVNHSRLVLPANGIHESSVSNQDSAQSLKIKSSQIA